MFLDICIGMTYSYLHIKCLLTPIGETEVKEITEQFLSAGFVLGSLND